MRFAIALLFLGSVVSMAGTITGGCPPIGFCGYSVGEAIVGDVFSIDFNAFSERGGGIRLTETLVTGVPGDPLPPGGFFVFVDLTFTALAFGNASAFGEFGPYFCGASSSGIPGPDAFSVVNQCFKGGSANNFSGPGLVPIDMQIDFGSGSGEVRLQASFSLLDVATGKSRPLSVNFAVPEPSSISLCVAGLLAAGFYRRVRTNRST